MCKTSCPPVHLDANGYLGVRRTDLYSQKLVNETLHVLIRSDQIQNAMRSALPGNFRVVHANAERSVSP